MPTHSEDYHRAPASSFGRIRIESITTRLVLLNVGAFVLDRILLRFGIHYNAIVEGGMTLDYPPVLGLAHFSIGLAFFKWELWRVFTWPFVHANTFHLLVNMTGLHLFGPVLESHYGPRRFLVFYLICGLCAPLACVLMMLMTSQNSPWIPLYSASGPVLAVLLAAAHFAPNTSALIYGMMPIKLRTLALGLLALTLYTTYVYARSSLGSNVNPSVQIVQTGGALAHLGSISMALLLVRMPQWVRLFDIHPFRRPPPF